MVIKHTDTFSNWCRVGGLDKQAVSVVLPSTRRPSTIKIQEHNFQTQHLSYFHDMCLNRINM